MEASLTLKKVMKQNDIQDIDTLLHMEDDEIRQLKGVGDKTFEEIKGLQGDDDYDLPPIDDDEAPAEETAEEPAPVPQQDKPAEPAKEEAPKHEGVRAGFEKKRAEETERIGDSLLEVENQALPILEEIKKHTLIARQAMDQSPIPLQTLANEEVELSILLQRLAERIAMAGYVLRSAENHLDYCRESYKVIFVNEGNAAGVADSMKKLEAQEEFEVANHAKYVFDNINLTRKSTEKTIDTLRSKLSFEKISEQR